MLGEDLRVGAARGRQRPSYLLGVDAVHRQQGRVHRVAVGVRGARDERAVDVEEEEHPAELL